MSGTAAHSPRSVGALGGWVIVACAFAGVLAWYVRRIEERVVARAWVDERSEEAPRPIAEVASAMRRLQLVTVEIHSVVEVESRDDSWRGGATAKVRVPVKLLYGTDLSQMKIDAVSFSPLTGAYVVRVPRPSRVATEVFGTSEETEVQVGWARLRSRAGEYHLGQARKNVSDQARRMVLSPEDARKVADATREQVGKLMTSIVGATGAQALVDVRFDEEERP